jgi:hypothetical protein
MGPDPGETGPHAGARVLRAHHARVVGRSAVRLDVLTQPEKCQDCEDDHHKADEVDNIVHAHPLCVGSRIESRTPRASRHTNTCRTLPLWTATPHRGDRRGRGMSHSDT